MFPSDMDVFIASGGVIAVQCELRIEKDGIHVRSRLAPIPETDEMAISVFLMCASHLAEGTPLESAIDACLDLKDAMLRQKADGAGSKNTASSASVGDDV